MKYPTLKEVEKASRLEICRWYRFLPSPSDIEESAIITAVVKRFNELGGMSTEISKTIGWNDYEF